MALHQFDLSQKGRTFYYDNRFNGLFDENKKPLSKDHGLSDDYINFVSKRNEDSNKVIKKSNTPVMIKVVLGHKCNYSCGYCMQDELSSKNDQGKIKTEEGGKAIALKEKIERFLDISKLQRMELWGGEAFLYWEDVKTLLKTFDREGMTFYLPTNGSLIRKHHIDFFRDLKATICIGISHDGPSHTITRGRDFLEDSADVFKEMQKAHPKVQFSFNPVISSENYDLFAVNDFFVRFLRKHGLKNVPLMYEIIQVYELAEVRGTSRTFALSGEKLEKYGEILREYLKSHHNQYMALGPGKVSEGDLLVTNLYELYSGSMSFAKTLHQQDIMHAGAKCQADQELQLSIDMEGNVRTCQNVGSESSFGNIEDITSVEVTNIDTNQGPHCGDCRVRFLCSGQCPIKQHEDVFETNCKINKVHYSAIQDAGFEFLFKTDVNWNGMVTQEI